MLDQLLPNSSVFIMWGYFVAVLIAFHYLVFKPTLAIVDYRMAQTDHRRTEAVSLRAQTQKQLEKYDHTLAELRMKAAKAREEIISIARQKEASLLDQARKDADHTLDKMRDQILKQKHEAEFQLKQYAQELSQVIVNKMLG